MPIKLNIRPADIIVYDKVNLKHGKSNEVVTMIKNVHGDTKDTIIDIISNSLNLVDSEIELYKELLSISRVTNVINVSEAISKASHVHGKSNTTYRRANDKLISLGVIRYCISYNCVIINDDYNVDDIVNNAKYIVIEII